MTTEIYKDLQHRHRTCAWNTKTVAEANKQAKGKSKEEFLS
jgi:hypothetical protein